MRTLKFILLKKFHTSVAVAVIVALCGFRFADPYTYAWYYVQNDTSHKLLLSMRVSGDMTCESCSGIVIHPKSKRLVFSRADIVALPPVEIIEEMNFLSLVDNAIEPFCDFTNETLPPWNEEIVLENDYYNYTLVVDDSYRQGWLKGTKMVVTKQKQ